VLDDHLLEEKNISTLKKLLNWHQLHYLRKVNSCSKNVALMRRYLRKKFIRVESTHFFGRRQKLWTLQNLFSTEGRLHNANDNVVSYHKDSVAALLDLGDKKRPENITFPFLTKSLPGYRDTHQIISIIL
jgi:hypothetical protein